MKTRIICLEGEWDEKQDVTVKPLLKLLQSISIWKKEKNGQITFRHYLCQSVGRLEHKLKHPDLRTLRTLPSGTSLDCLYLSFHGSACGLHIGKEQMSFEEVAECVDTNLKGKIAYFSSCGGDGSEEKLREFKKNTSAKLVIGYGSEVDWLVAALFEISFFSKLTSRGKGVSKAFKDELRAVSTQAIFQELKVIVL